MEEEFKKPTLPTITPIKVTKTNHSESLEAENVGTANVSDQENDGDMRGYCCPYKVPPWSGSTANLGKYSFEVLKSGQIIGELDELETKPYWTFGRLSENDFELAHPTISRFHAVLQYRPKVGRKNENSRTCSSSKKDNGTEDFSEEGPPEGWYIYDLDSTHGTFLNKQRLPPRIYIRIRVGHILRLGGSTRSYILQGPCEDEEPEAELTVTELKAERKRQQQQQLEKQLDLFSNYESGSGCDDGLEMEKGHNRLNDGCNWGMAEDADEETDLTHNPYATTNNEELFLDDPKKTLRGYFEREGLQLEYKCDEMSVGCFICRVELPIDDSKGHPVIAEVVHKGRKKDCVAQCALEACRILDRHGVLRQANQEPRKRRVPNNRSDSDDDEFLDRTGDIARRKQRKANAASSTASGASLTYEDLVKKEQDLQKQLDEIRYNINNIQEKEQKLKAQSKIEDNDDLDSYMDNLQDYEPKVDRLEIRKLRQEELLITSELEKFKRLMKITKPTDYSFLNTSDKASSTANVPENNVETKIKRKSLPLIGKRNQFSTFKVIPALPTKSKTNGDEKVKNLAQEAVETNVLEKNTETVTEERNDRKMESEPIEEDVENEVRHETKSDSQQEKNNDGGGEIASEVTAQEISVDKRCRKKIPLKTRRPESGDEQAVDDKDHYDLMGKYVKWMPPPNQTGDGITALNEKYGY